MTDPLEEDAIRFAAGTHLVAVVDDEPYILASIRRLLRGEPYELRTTERPAQLLDWVQTARVSLVITDQRMPEMKGTRLLQEVEKLSPATGRALLTGDPGSTIILRDFLRVVEWMIVKPWDERLFRRTIGLALARYEQALRSPRGLPRTQGEAR